MNTWIARRSTGGHYIISEMVRYPRKPRFSDTDPAPLLCTRNLKQLMAVLNEIPGLSVLDGSRVYSSRRSSLSSSDVSEQFEPCNEAELDREACFGTARASGKGKCLSGAIATYGFFETGQDGLDGREFVAIPLGDWLFARNTLSLMARIIGTASSAPGGDCLERCGFVREERYLIAPVALNPYASPWPRSLEGDVGRHPSRRSLVAAMCDVANGKNPYGNKTAFFRGRDGESGRLVRPYEDVDSQDGYLYIVASQFSLGADNPEDQSAVANRLLNNLVDWISKLKTSELGFDGWSIAVENVLSGNGEVVVKPRSLYSKLAYDIVSQEGRRSITICPNCGNAVFSPAHAGAPRRFCSPSCRVTYGRKHPGGGDRG